MSFRGSALWASVVVIGATSVAGCGGTHPSASSSPTSSASVYAGGSSSASPTQNPSQEQTPTPSTTSAPVKDPLASASIAPVIRDGKTPHPSQTAAPTTLKGVVRYGDGVSLRVLGIKQGTVTAEGPGEVDGPITTFTLSLTNGSKRTLNLSQVVVTLVYGIPGRIARPTYTNEEQDFSGNVKPGGSATASYTFAVPVAQRDRVVVHVDFDSMHTAAVFSGSSTS